MIEWCKQGIKNEWIISDVKEENICIRVLLHLLCKDKDLFWAFAVLGMFCVRSEPFPLPLHVWIKTLTLCNGSSVYLAGGHLCVSLSNSVHCTVWFSWGYLTEQYWSHHTSPRLLRINRPGFVIGTLHLPFLLLSSWDWQRYSLKWIQIHAGNKDHGAKHKNYNPLRIALYLLQAQPFSLITRLLLEISQLSWAAAESQLHFIAGWEGSCISRDLRVCSSHRHLVCHLEECNPESSTGQLFHNEYEWTHRSTGRGYFCWKRVRSSLRHSWTLQYQLPLTPKKQIPIMFPKGGVIYLDLCRKFLVIPCLLVNRLVLSMQEIELEVP